MDATRKPDTDQPLIADIYCRLSLAVMGDTTKVDDQERIAREIAARRGWTVGEVHKDNSRSAWQRNRKRPGWERMLARVRDGLVGAIITYHGDRLMRQPHDLEVLVDFADKQGIRVVGVMGERNLDSADDRYILRIETAAACRESDNISRRQKANNDRRRRQGMTRPGGRGGRCAGFATDGITHLEQECEWIREAAERIRAGDSTGSVGRDLAARGWTAPTGGPITRTYLKRLLLRPRMAGLMPDGKTAAAWKPVLDREVWEDVTAILTGRAALYPGKTTARVHLLSGIPLCGGCSQPVQLRQAEGTKGRYGGAYGCMNRECDARVFRSVPHMDEYITGRVLGALNDDRFLGALAAPGSAGAIREITQLERRRDETRQQLEQLADHPEVDPVLAAAALGSFTRKIDALREGMQTTARARLLHAHRGLTREGWDALPLGTQRALVTGTVTVEIFPCKRGPGFDSASIKVTPR